MARGISIVLLFLFTACIFNNEQEETGTLTGYISIGPLCPVETNPPSPACQPTHETYAAYELAVYTQKNHQLMAVLVPTVPDGYYSIALEAGHYVVDYRKPDEHKFGSDNLPVEVSIVSGSVVNLDIDIDTGIR